MRWGWLITAALCFPFATNQWQWYNYQPNASWFVTACALGFFFSLFMGINIPERLKDHKRTLELKADRKKTAASLNAEQRWYKEQEARKAAIVEEWRTTDYVVPSLNQFHRDLYSVEFPKKRFAVINVPLSAVSANNLYQYRIASCDRTTHTVEEMKRAYADLLALCRQPPITFDIPAARRFEGMWIIAPPGKGKTNLLWQLVDQDLDGTKTVVLMDSKGDLINPFRNHPDAIVIDYNNAAMNPLQLGGQSAMQFLQYLFSSLLEVQMTGLQKTLFSAILEVLLKTPNATIEHFRDILNYGVEGYEDALAKCSTDTRNFFTYGKPTEFNNSTYKDTKDQLKWRLRLLLQNEYLRRIFTSTHMSHDFVKLLDSKKLIILDVSKKVLWDEGTEFFGRFFIAMIWMGAVARSEMREQDKVPVHLYIDECHTVMARDSMFRAIIQECRSQKVAITCAHQYLADLTDVVKPALFNCGIRIANADDDASQLAPRLNAEKPDDIKLPEHQFAVFIRQTMKQPVVINVPFLDLSKIPQKAYVPPPEPEPQPRHATPQPEPPPEPPPQPAQASEPPKKKQKPFKKDRRTVHTDDDLDFG